MVVRKNNLVSLTSGLISGTSAENTRWLLCRDFSDIDVPRTDDILYIGKYIDLSMYDTRLLKRYLPSSVCVFLFDDDDDDNDNSMCIRRADTARALAR